MDMAISSRIRAKIIPRSAHTTVTCRISSSNAKEEKYSRIQELFRLSVKLPKHCLYSSRRTGQIPVSRAWVCCRRASSNSCKLITSWRVDGTLDTCNGIGISALCDSGDWSIYHHLHPQLSILFPRSWRKDFVQNFFSFFMSIRSVRSFSIAVFTLLIEKENGKQQNRIRFQLF